MNFLKAEQYLSSYINHELNLKACVPERFNLARVDQALAALGSPHKSLKCVHVAGSKGKGSASAFTAHILKAAGYRVGLYTSPHLYDLRERIRVLERVPARGTRYDLFPDCISEEEFCGLLEEIKPRLEASRHPPQWGALTYFEVLTILAFCYFEKKKVDVAVLETGLGGRLDATNVVEPLVCAITPISLEHTQQLGNTLAAIAQEKAAIIKPRKDGSPAIAVIAPQPGEAKAVIEQRCREVGARPMILGKDIQCRPVRVGTDGQDFVVSGQRAEYDLTSSLLGRHQVTNAAMAVGLCEALSLLGFNIRREAVREGIAATFWPGRFERAHENPRVILDGAHNPASCQTLAETFQDVFPQKKAVVILGMSDDKEKKGILENLSAIAQEFIFTQSRHPRAYRWKAEDGGTQAAGVLEAVELGLKTARPDDAIVVTGSLFVVAEARRYFDESKSRNR